MRARIQQVSGLGQFHPLRVAFEHAAFQHGFNQTDLMADSGGADIQLPGSLLEAKAIGNRMEGAQCTQRR
ncbi:hypothetical protein D3C73_1378190 [compost metagenome]